MSNQAINYRNPRINRLQRGSNIYNCPVHGEIGSIHNRCPQCYRDRMKEYSSGIRNRNIIPRPPNNRRIINNHRRSYSAPEVNLRNNRYSIRLPPIGENVRTNIIPARPSQRNLNNSRNTYLPRLSSSPYLTTNLSRNIQLRENNINNLLRLQNLYSEDDIRNISLRDRQETPVNLHVLSRDTSICHAPSSGNCAICQEDWENGEVVRKLPCEHGFHIMCIDKWFSENNACPVCRYTMARS